MNGVRDQSPSRSEAFVGSVYRILGRSLTVSGRSWGGLGQMTFIVAGASVSLSQVEFAV